MYIIIQIYIITVCILICRYKSSAWFSYFYIVIIDIGYILLLLAYQVQATHAEPFWCWWRPHQAIWGTINSLKPSALGQESTHVQVYVYILQFVSAVTASWLNPVADGGEGLYCLLTWVLRPGYICGHIRTRSTCGRLYALITTVATRNQLEFT